jgi:hypothetical protein
MKIVVVVLILACAIDFAKSSALNEIRPEVSLDKMKDEFEVFMEKIKIDISGDFKFKPPTV